METTYTDLGTASREGHFADHVLDLKTAGREDFHMVELCYPAGSYPFTGRPEFSLSRTISIEAPGKMENEFARRDHRRYAAGDLEIAVPETQGVWTTEGRTHIIMMSMPVGKIAEALEGEGAAFDGDFGRLHDASFRSETILTLFDQLWRETRPGRATNGLLADGLFNAILAQLLDLSYKKGNAGTQAAYGLSTPARRRVDERIAAAGDARLYAKDLADAAGMPLTTFSRALKAATGMSPHQYVVNARLERARDILAASPACLATVAARAGFASQSHMTDLFRKKLGVTPAAYRKSINA